MTTFKDILKTSFIESFDGAWGGGITFRVILISMALTIVLALYLFLIYRLIGRKNFYNMNFNLALVGMTVATAAIVLTIQSNLMLSLGMVGALSIVRYRSAVKDPMDLFFLFWGVAVGIMCGARQFLLAATVSFILTVVLFILSHVPVILAPYVLVVNCREEDLEAVKDLVACQCRYYKVKSSYLSDGKMRVIMEIKTKSQDELLRQLGKMSGVAVSILTYEGDIVG